MVLSDNSPSGPSSSSPPQEHQHQHPSIASTSPTPTSASSSSTAVPPDALSSSSSIPPLHSRRRRATLQGERPSIIISPTSASSPNPNKNTLIDPPEPTPIAATTMELTVQDSENIDISGANTPKDSKDKTLNEDQPVQQSFFGSLVSRIRGRRGVVSKGSTRVIPISSSRTTPLIQPETGKPYVSNAVTTARYNMWDFLPKQLYAQFSKIANVYFLFVASLQMVPSWSPTGQYTTLVPLLVFLSIAIAHEGYDDYRRHRQDNGENNQPTNVFRSYRNATNSVLPSAEQRSPNPPSRSHSVRRDPSGELSITIPLTPAGQAPSSTLAVFQKIKWKDLAVGDIVRVDQNDWVPADLILLHSSGTEGGCYVETAALDGETNLKQRQALKVTNDTIRTPEDIDAFTGMPLPLFCSSMTNPLWCAMRVVYVVRSISICQRQLEVVGALAFIFPHSTSFPPSRPLLPSFLLSSTDTRSAHPLPFTRTLTHSFFQSLSNMANNGQYGKYGKCGKCGQQMIERV